MLFFSSIASRTEQIFEVWQQKARAETPPPLQTCFGESFQPIQSPENKLKKSRQSITQKTTNNPIVSEIKNETNQLNKNQLI